MTVEELIERLKEMPQDMLVSTAYSQEIRITKRHLFGRDCLVILGENDD